MSYEKTTWTNGDVITAEKLNHIENGIENQDFVIVTFSQENDTWIADKTLVELQEAYEAGKHITSAQRIGNGIRFPLTTSITNTNGTFMIVVHCGLEMTDNGGGNIAFDQTRFLYSPAGILFDSQTCYVAKVD